MTQAFYRKWRPQVWDEVIAQDHVVQTLRNAVRTGRTGHAYLLAGPRGTGKTTTARLLAKALNCTDPDPANRPCDHCAICQAINEARFLDLIEIDAASNTSVDDVRDLRDKINFRPSQGQYKVYIIDEVHMLSTAAFNALLKTLEEPPQHAIFILATTEVHKIPATILSRVQRFEFRRIPVTEIASHLKKKAAEENIQIDDEAINVIARQATGAMRDAISLLDQLASTGERVTLKEAQEVLGTATSELVLQMVDAVLEHNTAAGINVVHSALDSGTDARQFARQIVDYLRSVLLVRLGSGDRVEATADQRVKMAEHARKTEPHQLVEMIRLFNTATTDARSGWHPGLAMELAVVQSSVATASATELLQPSRTVVMPEQEKQPAVPAATTTVIPSRERQPTVVPVQQASTRKDPPAPVDQRAQNTMALPASQELEEPQAADSKGRAITQQVLQQNWPRIRLMVKRRNVMTEGLMNSCRFVLKDQNTLVLSFQAPVVKSKMETAENIDLLRQAIQSILGVDLTIRCVLGGKGGQAVDNEIEGDSILGTALDLGGKIVFEE